MRQCTEDDFGKSAYDKQNYKDWLGWVTICPDFKPGEDLQLEGDVNSMQ